MRLELEPTLSSGSSAGRESPPTQAKAWDGSGCLPDGALFEQVMDAMSPERLAQAQAHQAVCAACRQRLADVLDSTFKVPRGEQDAHRSLAMGGRVGRFVVLERLGVGGMGEVFAAYDPDLDRKIALKLLRADVLAGHDKREAHARLLREAQAVAHVSHPNVIAIHDVGLFDSDVFIALELVQGETLRAWLDETGRSTREVLRVFLDAGRGLAAAHAAGLVHRDFKPENVLISDAGQVKVLDFGLACTPSSAKGHEGPSPDPALTSSLSTPLLSTPLTQAGALVGTPAYMAPEQLAGNEADARSDQFAFCASLYEALNGCRPFSGDTVLTRTASIARGELERGAASRKVPARVQRALRRGLSFAPGDRFASMESLLATLEDTSRATTGRALIALGLTLAAAVPGALAWGRAEAPIACPTALERLEGVWDARAREAVRRAFLAVEKPYAADAWQATAKALDAFVADWSARQDQTCQALREQRERSSESLWLQKLCLEHRLDELTSLQRVLARADDEIAENAEAAVGALTPPRSCADGAWLRAMVRPPSDPTARAAYDQVRLELNEGTALLLSGKYADGLALAQRATDDARRLRFLPLVAETLFLQSRLFDKTGLPAKAERTAHEALVAAEASGHDELAARGWSFLTWVVGARLARHEEGHLWAQHARAFLTKLGERPEDVAELRNFEGSIALGEGDYERARAAYDEALGLRERALGPDHREVGVAAANLAIALSRLGRLTEALALYRRAERISEDTVGLEHPRRAQLLHNMAITEAKLGHYEEALAAYEQAARILERTLGPNHPDLGVPLASLSAAYLRAGRTAEALEAAQRGLAIRRAELGPKHPGLAESLSSVALVHLRRGEDAQALALSQQALALSQEALGPRHPSTAARLLEVGAALGKLGRHQEALDTLTRAVAITEGALGPDSLPLSNGLELLGVEALALRRPAQAVGLFERAHAIGRRGLGDQHPGVLRLAKRLEQARAEALARPE